MLQTASARSSLSSAVDTTSTAAPSTALETISRAAETSLLAAALHAALDALPVPAAILSASGVVRYSNEAARGLLRRDLRAFSGAIHGGASPDDPAATFSVQALDSAPGGHILALHRRSADPAPAALRWRRRFRLTGRQTLILEHLARGLASKSIAEILDCSEKTVAFHVSAIFDKTGVDSRAALVARFWTER